MSTTKRYLFLTLSFCLWLSSFGQVDSKALQSSVSIAEQDTQMLLFSFSNTNFIKNNEYFWKIATGYTYLGSQLNPQLAWIPNKHLRMQGGVYFRKDFGNTTIQDIQATFSMKVQNNGLSLIMGNLEGHLNHKLIEPLFNFERSIINPMENGIQMKIDKERIWVDTWMDWELQEYQGSPFQEHVTGGFSSKTTLVQAENESKTFKIQLPLQAIIAHKGGQIDADTNSIQSLANTAAGIIFDLDLSKKDGLISGIRSDNYYVYYKDVSPSPRQPYISGTGVYLNLLFQTKFHINLMTSYWDGSFFMAPRGGFLYQSVSSIVGKTAYMEDKRRLVLVRLMYQHEILPNLFADIRYEPYFDLGNKFFDEYSYSIYFTYRKDFDICRIRPRKLD